MFVLLLSSVSFSIGFCDNASALIFVFPALYTTSKSYSANLNLHLVTREQVSLEFWNHTNGLRSVTRIKLLP